MDTWKLQCPTLPNETLSNIFLYLDPPDIKNVRLASHNFDKCGRPYLIPRLYIAPLPEILDVVIEVAEHPIFRYSVTEVVLDLLLQDRYPLEARLDSKTTYESRWHYAQCLKHALSNLPNVVSISLTDEIPNKYVRTVRPSQIAPHDAFMSYAWFRLIAAATLISPYPTISSLSTSFSVKRGFSIQTGCLHGLLGVEFPSPFPPQAARMLFTQLRHLALDLSVLETESDLGHPTKDYCWGALGELLESAQDLRTLYLQFYDDSPPRLLPREEVHTKLLLPTCQWSFLTELSLGGMEMGHPELCSLVLAIKGTLRTLQLVLVGLVGSTWFETAQFFGASLHLKSVNFHCLNDRGLESYPDPAVLCKERPSSCHRADLETLALRGKNNAKAVDRMMVTCSMYEKAMLDVCTA